jgi:hypothetical protein
MLRWLRRQGRLTDRKARLFGCACCAVVWDLLEAGACRTTVELAERYADGRAEPQDLDSAGRMAYYPRCKGRRSARHEAHQATHALLTPDDAGRVLEFVVETVEQAHFLGLEERLTESAEPLPLPALLRCVFSDASRPLPGVDPAWLIWNGGLVRRIAEAAYDDRAFDRLLVLADALEAAGCGDAEVLGHLRGPGPHVRGCWAVDLLLGKG